MEAIKRHAMARFEQAVGDWQGVVEDSFIREIAHGEVVDPAKRAGMAAARRVDSLDQELAREHGFTLNRGAQHRKRHEP